MIKDNNVLMAKNGDKEFVLLSKMANRHGLIAGATGSGKTVTLKVMAEGFSAIGVPVFLSDVKGDLAGMCKPGVDNENMQERIQRFNISDSFKYQSFPAEFYDINRKNGLPIRTTISNFGPTLLSYVLELNDTQSDVMNVLFKISDEAGLLLIDLKDLKAMLEFMTEHNNDLKDKYGSISKASISTILRSLVSLEQEGLDLLFGEPDLKIEDFFRLDENGKGYINILHSENLILNPRIYSAFMLWLLSTLYEAMPEVGDLDKPKIVFFFDEAHLLFENVSKALLKKIDQITKLIRSKGIGLYYITQTPTDIPDDILNQLGNKIQHVLRVYTAKDQRNLKAVVDSYRLNEKMDLSETIQNLGTGEAVVSFLDQKGMPTAVDKAYILPPESQMGIITTEEREQVIKQSDLYPKYYKDIDRESAFEMLQDEDNKIEREKMLGIDDEVTRQKKVASEVKKQQEKDEINTLLGKTKKTKSPYKSILNTSSGSVGRELGRELSKAIFGSNTAAKNIAGNIGASIARGLMGNFFS